MQRYQGPAEGADIGDIFCKYILRHSPCDISNPVYTNDPADRPSVNRKGSVEWLGNSIIARDTIASIAAEQASASIVADEMSVRTVLLRPMPHQDTK